MNKKEIENIKKETAIKMLEALKAGRNPESLAKDNQALRESASFCEGAEFVLKKLGCDITFSLHGPSVTVDGKIYK